MFSVVIPLYNKELSIANTIQSVLDQTCQDFEIVVVNDDSTDLSAEIVEQINDPRIRLIHQKNQGVSAARNTGTREAKYEWIAFLDGDDLWEKEHLEEVIKMMQLYPNEKVYVTSFEYSDGRPMFKHERSTNIFKIENYFKEALKESLMWTSIVVVNKSCIDKVGGFNEKLNRGEDLDLWIRLAREYDIVKSSKVTAVYRIEDVNSLSKGKSNYYKSILSTINLKGKTGDERKYYKRMLISRLKTDIKHIDIIELSKIVAKHNIELLK